MTSDYEIMSEQPDEINIFDALPLQETAGTAYDYLMKFPYFDDEIFYLLECATRENANPDEVIKQCKEIVDQRQKYILDNFEKRDNPDELFIPFEKFSYQPLKDDEQGPDIPKQQERNPEPERGEE